MNFCPNCGTKLAYEGLKFCPECGAKIQPTAIPPASPMTVTTSAENESAVAFDLLKRELSAKAGDVAREISSMVIEKWKASGRYPKRMGSVVDAVVERVLPPLVEMKVRSMPWKNEGATETPNANIETSVSTSFPVELQTGIPLLGKITLNEVRLTMKGLVDVKSGNVSQLGVAGVDLA